jgi:hypothetical protein
VNRIVVEIGAGELLDRLTIVEIKLQHARSDAQRVRLRTQLNELQTRATGAGLFAADFEPALAELRATNQALWRIEDDIRDCEAGSDFGQRFIELARAVYTKNDLRSRIKRQVDERYGAAVPEEKIYCRREPA